MDQFNAVLVGSSIRIGKWTKEAKNFLKKNNRILMKKPFLAVYVSSGDASYPEKYQEAKEKYVRNIITDLGYDLSKVTHEAFGGLFDMSDASKMGWQGMIKKLI